MNGDLSLSQALGGLRIANPDGDPEEEQALATVATDSNRDPTQASSSQPSRSDDDVPLEEDISSHSNPPDIPNTASNQLSASSDPLVNQRQPRPGYPSQVSTQLPSRYPDAPYKPSAQQLRRAHSARLSPSNSFGPELTGAWTSSPYPESPSFGLSRTDSRAGAAYAGSAISRAPSQRVKMNRQAPLPVGSGPLPPRGISRAVPAATAAAGYASVPQPYDPLPASSEEWKDRGAAVGVRKEVDANGRTVMRTVKKGVRDFNFGHILGEGSYSTVYLATDRQTLKEYAIKVLDKKHIIKEKKIKYVNIEKNTLNRLTEHPGIVRLYYTFQDESSLFYVLDLCNGGELLGVLKKTGTFDMECTRFYGAQILDAIEYMHSRGIIHRDLKPENVLLDDQMHVKITDFGTAKQLKDPRDPDSSNSMPGAPPDDNDRDRAASFVGTAEYVSPELLTNQSACKASDLWAFGCIIYQLLAGRPPFKAGTEYLTFQKIVALDYDFPDGFPPAARDLVERCLVLDPAQRLTIEHIKNHSFFEGHMFGKGLWRMKAPRLRPYVPPPMDAIMPQANGYVLTQQQITASRAGPPQQNISNGTARPSRIITELPPPTQLDIEWSPVLTKSNERILKLGDLLVISSPLSSSPGKGSEHEGHKKLARFFGGNTTKKRQRLVMITSSGRIVLAPAGGEEKRSKHEISLLASDCAWRTQVDVKGQTVWCVDSGGTHYTFEEPKSSSASSQETQVSNAEEWIESLERARDLAVSQNLVGSDSGFVDMSSNVSSPASTLGGRAGYPEGFGVGDRSGRTPGKTQAAEEAKRNRFSKRQSKNGLGSAF